MLAFFAQTDLLGGVDRLVAADSLRWGDAAIGNLGIPNGRKWQAPDPHLPGWHKDGWHFRNFLNSFEQGLLTVSFFSNVLPRSGATFFAQDSIKPVAKLLVQTPHGLHPDSVQGAGFLIPGLIDLCCEFSEFTGSEGDVALVHPFVLHRVSVNPTRQPRFIANFAIVLKEPMNFKREPGDPYSLVELAVLYALDVNELDYQNTRQPRTSKPFPFRSEEESRREQASLENDMQALAEAGVVTPSWAEQCGYQSNRWAIRNQMLIELITQWTWWLCRGLVFVTCTKHQQRT